MKKYNTKIFFFFFMFVISLCITILSHSKGDIILRNIAIYITVSSLMVVAFYIDRRENYLEDLKNPQSDKKDSHLV